jgi:AcrR family transcriptional regulator
MDGIAQAAGVAKGTVYLYYKSKEDIFRQILEEDLANLQDDTVPLISGPGTIEDKLHAFFLGALGFFDRKKDFCEHAIFEMGSEVRKKALQRFEVVFRAQVQAWQTLLADAQRTGQIDVVDPRASASIIVGAASGLAKQRLRGWDTTPVDDVATQAARTLWKGLAAR